jgi:methionyl aminopeptidase
MLSNLITLKDYDWLARQRLAGKAVKECLETANDKILNSSISMLELNDLCHKIILKHNCKPTFYQYKGFPGYACISINNELVHGIPKNQFVNDGDIVKIDLGATYNGAIADAAITVIKGKPKKPSHKEMVDTCRNALENAIKNIKLPCRLGTIGNSINFVVKKTKFGLITNYGGHGIEENTPHGMPFVSNKSNKDEGVRLQPGITLAIEQMVVHGDVKTWVSSDGWTVMTNDVSSHFERTIFIHEDHVEVITDWNI